MKYNIKHGDNPEIARRQRKVQEILWSDPDVAQALKQAGLTQDISDLGDMLAVYVRSLGLPRTLEEMNISPDLIPALSERALADFWAPTNPIPLVRAEQVREILDMVA
jgi:alcohol dehydrogenase class IV